MTLESVVRRDMRVAYPTLNLPLSQRFMHLNQLLYQTNIFIDFFGFQRTFREGRPKLGPQHRCSTWKIV